ncbi:hypothetical protein V6N13_089149 [Hibiscus sabdariffa]
MNELFDVTDGCCDEEEMSLSGGETSDKGGTGHPNPLDDNENATPNKQSYIVVVLGDSRARKKDATGFYDGEIVLNDEDVQVFCDDPFSMVQFSYRAQEFLDNSMRRTIIF